MSDEPNKEDRLEHDYRRGRTWLEWLKVVALILTCVALLFWIWAANAVRNSANMTGKLNANANEVLVNGAGAVGELRDLIKKGNEKLDAVDVTKLNTTMDSGNAILDESRKRIRDLEPIENQASGAIADARTQSKILLGKVGVEVDELHAQTKQEGDALASVTLHADKLLADSTPRIEGAVTALERGMNGLATTVETSQPEVAEILSQFKTVIVDADGAVRGLEPIESNLAGITDDAHAMTTDSKNKLHEIFYPPKVKGFWPNVKRTFGFVLTPILDGTRIYFSLKALPVRITQPIPTVK